MSERPGSVYLMRDPDHPAFAAASDLNDALGERIAVPNGQPFSQLIWATFVRSKRTYEAIGHLLGHEFDTQAAMLCRPLFEDMLVGHWLELNRDDPDWLVERFFRHRDAMTLDQIEIEQDHPFGIGPLLVPDTKALRAEKNALGKEFKGRARRDWWDPCEHGRGVGSPIGIAGVAGILEGAAAKHKRFDPRFAGGETAMLRSLEAVVVNWFSRQLHHTAIGLPFQPNAEGPIEFRQDPVAALRILFTTYWTFGQQGFLLVEHLDQDPGAYERTFMQGLVVIGSEISPTAIQEKPIRPYSKSE
jgi:hypothetical protein